MKTPFSIWAPSAIHRGSTMPLRTSMLEEMPTLMSQAAITSTITQHRAGTTQQGLAHQTSQALTRVYPALLNKLRMGEPTSQGLVISLHFNREHSIELVIKVVAA